MPELADEEAKVPEGLAGGRSPSLSEEIYLKKQTDEQKISGETADVY